MKKLLFAALLLTGGLDSLSQTIDLQQQISILRNENSKLKSQVNNQASEIRRLQGSVRDLTAKDIELRREICAGDSALNASVNEVRSTLGMQLKSTDETVASHKATADREMQSIWKYGAVCIAALIVLSLLLYFMLRRRIGRGSDDLAEVKEANRKLEEQSVALDNKLASLLESQLKLGEKFEHVSTDRPAEADHSLVLSVANEMARIEQNLAFMDPKTKGVSQLKNRAAAIASSLKDKGYEIPALIGTEYKEGYNMDVTMEEDDSVEPGKMIIRRVVRPCVMYRGVMIQPASVAVAFNPDEQ